LWISIKSDHFVLGHDEVGFEYVERVEWNEEIPQLWMAKLALRVGSLRLMKIYHQHVAITFEVFNSDDRQYSPFSLAFIAHICLICLSLFFCWKFS